MRLEDVFGGRLRSLLVAGQAGVGFGQCSAIPITPLGNDELIDDVEKSGTAEPFGIGPFQRDPFALGDHVHRGAGQWSTTEGVAVELLDGFPVPRRA